MRAFPILAAALAILAAASPTVPMDAGRDGRDGLGAGTVQVADAGTNGLQRLADQKQPPPCPPAQPTGPHCVYLTLKKPSKLAAEKLAKKLRTDGLESDVSEEHQVSVSLGDAQLEKLLGAKVGYSLTAASASNRMVCDARVASLELPTRYAEVAAVRIDAQCP